MRAKVSRKIREAMEEKNGLNVLSAPEYFIGSQKKKVVYVMNDKNQPEAKVVDRIVIVNKTKNLYRKVKKIMKAQRRLGLKSNELAA